MISLKVFEKYEKMDLPEERQPKPLSRSEKASRRFPKKRSSIKIDTMLVLRSFVVCSITAVVTGALGYFIYNAIATYGGF